MSFWAQQMYRLQLMNPKEIVKMDNTAPIKLPLRSFDSKILYMNGMYKLPIAPYPSVSFLNGEAHSSRLANFGDILSEECKELDEVWSKSTQSGTQHIDTLTNLADLLGDIVVYCYSEAAKFGIPLSEVLSIIMDSNFSKLGADGQPIYDDRGKVQKGPFYWKPEPKIRALLEERIKESQNGNTTI